MHKSTFLVKTCKEDVPKSGAIYNFREIQFHEVFSSLYISRGKRKFHEFFWLQTAENIFSSKF